MYPRSSSPLGFSSEMYKFHQMDLTINQLAILQETSNYQIFLDQQNDDDFIYLIVSLLLTPTQKKFIFSNIQFFYPLKKESPGFHNILLNNSVFTRFSHFVPLVLFDCMITDRVFSFSLGDEGCSTVFDRLISLLHTSVSQH
jgi:hypothetical protein